MKRLPATLGYEVLLDDEDYERLSRHRWYAHNSGKGSGHKRPARRTCVAEGRKVLPLVHHIIKPPAGFVVDHINGDPWDNRRENLRVCTNRENLRNRRKRSPGRCEYKGILPNGKRFCARISCDGQSFNLGTYGSQKEAALAYDAAALFLHKEFACLNFPDAGTKARSPQEILLATDSRRFRGLKGVIGTRKCDAEVVELLKQGLRAREAADAVGISHHTAYSIARDHGLNRRRGRPCKLAQAA